MRLRARHAWLVVAAAAAPLGASACELIAGVHDVHLAAGSGGAGAEAGPDASDGGPDAIDGGPDLIDGGTDACPGAGGSAPGITDAGSTTPVPPGYARYCSGPSYQWHGTADPCANVRQSGSSVAHAGIYATAGWNRVLLRCPSFSGVPASFTGAGDTPINAAFNVTVSQKLHGCVYVIAPASLPVFSLPYGVSPCATDPGSDVDLMDYAFQVFNFDVYHQPWDVSAFNQVPYPPDSGACAVDRTGREQCYVGSAGECGGDAGCLIVPSGSRPTGLTYVWSMPAGKPLLAVANGTVVGSRDRDVSDQSCGATSLQKEISSSTRSSARGRPPTPMRSGSSPAISAWASVRSRWATW